LAFEKNLNCIYGLRRVYNYVPENIESITQTIRNLEALATNSAATPAESELAKAKAIEFSNKHNIPSIFTRSDYVPPKPKSKPFQPPAPPKPKSLKPKVLAMEASLKMEGWEFSCFRNGRIYKHPFRPNEEIHMIAHLYSEFECQHLYKPTGKFRQAGKTPYELDNFFSSVSYRLQLWPEPQYEPPPTPEDFYTWVPEPEQPMPERSETTEDASEGQERVDIIDEMLNQRKTYKKHGTGISSRIFPGLPIDG
jgi:hypothetical protein